MTEPAKIQQRLQAIESQLEALQTEKEQLLEEEASQGKERLNALVEKVRAACDGDEKLLNEVLLYMGYEPTARKRRADLEKSAQQLKSSRDD